MSRYYRLDGSPYDGEDPLMEWAMDLEAGRFRIVAQDLLWNGLFVSTIWMGLDHSFGFGPPLIFETMVFDQLHGERGADLTCERYSTLEQARLGHQFYVEDCSRFWPTVRRWFLAEDADEAYRAGQYL